MKKTLSILFLILILILAGCNKTTNHATATESVSADYGTVISLAKDAFTSTFKEFKDLQIEETLTMTRTDDAKEIIVQIKYPSNNGDGIYGFKYLLDDYKNPELVQCGKDVTIETLLQ